MAMSPSFSRSGYRRSEDYPGRDQRSYEGRVPDHRGILSWKTAAISDYGRGSESPPQPTAVSRTNQRRLSRRRYWPNCHSSARVYAGSCRILRYVASGHSRRTGRPPSQGTGACRPASARPPSTAGCVPACSGGRDLLRRDLDAARGVDELAEQLLRAGLREPFQPLGQAAGTADRPPPSASGRSPRSAARRCTDNPGGRT